MGRFERLARSGRLPRVAAARGASVVVGVLLVMLPAVGSWSQSQSLDSADVGVSRSLDDVEQATSGTPDGGRMAESESLDQMPAASAESLDSAPTTFGTSLDAAPVAVSDAPNNDDLDWRPTPCSQLPTPSIAGPQGADPAAWREMLDATQQRVASSKRDVDEATQAFGASLYRGEHLPATRVRLGEQRDAARKQYSEARCEMQASLDAARRAGVLPGTLRMYQTD